MVVVTSFLQKNTLNIQRTHAQKEEGGYYDALSLYLYLLYKCSIRSRINQIFICALIIFQEEDGNMSGLEEKRSVGSGAFPRVYPRPSYPSAWYMITRECRDIGVQSIVVGVSMSLLLFPYYSVFQNWLTVCVSDLGTTLNVEAVVFSIVASLTHIVCYAAINGMFGYFDMNNIFQEYKLPRKPYMVPTKAMIMKCLSEAALGQLVINPIASYYAYKYARDKGIMLAMSAPLPPVHELAIIYFCGHIFNDIGFYLAHRMFHSTLLYATFHKQHHTFAGTIGIAAEYANPVEQIVANLTPTLGGVILYSGHPFCLCLWLALRLKQTYEAHSGYCFRGTLYDRLGFSHCEQAIHHDYHHTVNTGNFGTEWMDWLFGTQDGFVAGGMFEGYLAKKKQKQTVRAA